MCLIGRLDGKEVGQVAIIARMNATLFDQMVKFIRSGRKLKLGFAGVSILLFTYLTSYSTLGVKNGSKNVPFHSTPNDVRIPLPSALYALYAV